MYVKIGQILALPCQKVTESVNLHFCWPSIKIQTIFYDSIGGENISEYKGKIFIFFINIKVSGDKSVDGGLYKTGSDKRGIMPAALYF